MAENQYIELFQECRQMIDDHSAALMNAVRNDAFNAFMSGGFPTRKVERYKYTDLQKIFKPNYGLNLKRLAIPVDPYKTFSCDVPNLSTSLYFVVNDAFYVRNEEQEEKHDRIPQAPLPEGVIIGSLREYLSQDSPLAAKLSGCYAKLAKVEDDGVTALNTMLAQDGMLVYVPRNVKVERAIQVINILRADVDLMVNRRVLIVLEEGAEIKLLFCDHAADDRHFLTTQVIEAFVGERANLSLYCMEETHAKSTRVSNVYIDQQADSKVQHNIITLHNGTTRNKLDLNLSGEGAECFLGGCVIADKQQHVDNNTLITHHVPRCQSRQLYKYVLDEQATGAFAGRVYVGHGADKTISQMTNQNLITTPDARMYTQPMLEIYVDDVKCAHGSTVGQLNDAAMFYMRQRGISEKEARTLLIQAFINEAVGMIELSPLRDRLHYLVEKRIRGEFDKCKGCKLCR